MSDHPKAAPYRANPTHGEPGHVYTPDEWARIEAEAQQHAAHAEPVHPGLLTLGRSAFPSVTGFVQCKYDGGPQPAGGPKFGVLHDAETPLANGYAASIASYFTRNTNSTSAHFMGGPDVMIQMLDTSRIAWGCGNGNPRAVQVEMAGLAALTPAQWTTALGMQQMGRVASLLRDIRAAHDIGLYWMTDQQLRDAEAGRIVGGWATHDQCRRVLGGTTHTDPMPNYPLDQLMALANNAPEDDMQLTDTINFGTGDDGKPILVTVAECLRGGYEVYNGIYKGGPSTPGKRPLAELIGAIPYNVWWESNVTTGKDDKGKDITVPVIQYLSDGSTASTKALVQIAALQTALQTVIQEVAKQSDADPAAIGAAVDAAIEKALANSTVKVEVSVAGASDSKS